MIKTREDLEAILFAVTKDLVKIRKVRVSKLSADKSTRYNYSNPAWLKNNGSTFLCDTHGNLKRVILYDTLDPWFFRGSESTDKRIESQKYISKLNKYIAEVLDPSIDCEHLNY